MSIWRFVLASLRFHWRVHLAVSLGIAAGTAVLTGALLVGDSVRGSLRHLTLDRLGRIDEALATDRFFAIDTVERLAADPRFQRHYTAAVPAILFPRGTLERHGSSRPARASQILIVGSDASFWELGDPRHRPRQLPGRDEIVVNAPLAEDLQLAVGDRVVLRLPSANQVPADSPLGRKSERVSALSDLRVTAIVPAESLGRFSLTASQMTPRNAYVASETLQAALDERDRVNAILVAGPSADRPPDAEAERALAQAFRPSLEDYGFALRRVRTTFPADASQPEAVVFDYLDLTTDRLMLSPPAAAAVHRAVAPFDAQPVSTYLANALDKVGAPRGARSIPYSLITATASQPVLGPLVDDDARPIHLADDEIALNSWTARELEAAPGDRIRVTFYRPESVHGRLEEETAEFRVKAVVPLTEPAQPMRRNRPAVYARRPTLVNDPDLTPTVDGFTDQESIDRWDAPFPVDRSRIRPADDEYWRNHRTTPKAFVSPAAGRRLWGSRFGEITSLRIPIPSDAAAAGLKDKVAAALVHELDRDRAALGFAFLPVKQRGLAASAGTTPFDVLFLMLSTFIIVAALLLVALLFRLGVERRAREIGTLRALGFRPATIARLLTAEACVVSAGGATFGVILGVAYAATMLIGLTTWWLGAILTPFLRLYMTPPSLMIGWTSGLIVGALTIRLSLRQAVRVSIRRLLGGQTTAANEVTYAAAGRAGWIVAGGLLAAAGASSVAARAFGGEAQAGVFVAAGMLALAGLLSVVRRFLKMGGRAGLRTAITSLRWLAIRNVARNPGRSVLTVGLVAVASFLIVAMSAFRLAPTESGTGGFDLIAESAEPVFGDWSTPQGREQLVADRAAMLDGVTVLSLRMQAGDDASCLNLYQSAQPRILGVTQAFIRHFDDSTDPAFTWSASAARAAADRANPWRLLSATTPRRAAADPDEQIAIPVVLDQNTALYSLHLYGGVGAEFELTYPGVGEVRFRVAGLLSNSILQGVLLIGEADFLACFPDVSGYRYFLIRAPDGRAPAVAATLEDRLSDQGLAVTSARERLADLLAVQNTYLSTFQSLGALGLLLGTFGLAAVQIRNIVERRGELALLRAVGFRRRRLAGLVMLETLLLLVGGLASGFLAASFITLPQMLSGAASIPLADPAMLLAVVLVVGSLTSLVCARTVLRTRLLAALRAE